jgi:prepilin-type N-terminal cleavage/methylation domain-containing protein
MTRYASSRRAFSLIELLIVILIIALVIAIVLPALGHARTGARKAATTSLMSTVQSACSSFILSERKMPGYFSAKELGSTENGVRGFTAMENVMFDLAGGIAPVGTGWACGPTAAHTVQYSPDLVGVPQGGNKAYFTPPSKYFKYQNGGESGDKAAADPQGYHRQYIRDLVDAEGTPILMWATDPMAIQPVNSQADFAALASDGGPANALPARFYWNSNAAFLNSANCGDKRINETDLTKGSLLALGNNTAVYGLPARIASMVGLLGNPSSPNNITAASNDPAHCLPTAPRGQFVIQSAGANGTYLGRDERGGKTATNNALTYNLNFRNQPASDVMADFDDVLVAGG